ncbi:ribonuclease D [Rosenbergiella nectarea]|uniref:ribonuclease D n=1 Tax=Rosenbergiella nectarea TaxID=988801 RepID=UPI001BD9A283|nr:ribonuclease D [Rosenbergiella nectarea]MBT0729402.1 ribonuclease D [Rosenbergiella nectarea subsp. apis]
MLSYRFIETDRQLIDCCKEARQVEAVALDTEFVRTRTYFPLLGLIQLYDGQHVSLIDPLKVTDWQPFVEMLTDKNVVKYLHAGGEDLEVFLNRFNVVPTPMLDTQIMAAFLGKPSSWGFAAMVAQFTGIQLDKSESRTDWLARPLTEKQCQYAAADVEYLLPIAKKLHQHAVAEEQLAYIESECALQILRRQIVIDPGLAYLDIAQAWQLTPRQLAILQGLAEWRLHYARQHNMAVNFVVKEELLWKTARYSPSSLAELRELGAIGPEIRFHGETLLALVKQGEAVSEDALPRPVKNIIDIPNYRQLFAQLKEAVKQVSASSGYSQEMLASRRQLNQLISAHWKLKPRETQPELLYGWRGELLANSLNEILAQY